MGKSLCDDVLSSKTGILRGTTRILVTNQLNQIGDLDVDQIVLIKDDRIALKCTYDELMEMERNGQLDEYNLRLTQNQKTDETDEEDKKSEKSNATNDSTSSPKSSDGEKKKDTKSKKLIEKEKQEEGDVEFKHYLVFLKNFGYLNAVIIMLLLACENYSQVYSRIYLAEWTENKPNTTDAEETRSFHRGHMFYYAIYSLGECVFGMLEDTVVFAGYLSIFRSLHQQLLYKVLRSPMRFFEKTPVGRIINR